MTLLKASRMPLLAGLLCLLLLGFAGASYGAVRFDVIGAPTEVINTGRSENTGSVTLSVTPLGFAQTTGTSTGGAAQIAFIYTNPAMQIDNTGTTGIKLILGGAFNTGNVELREIENFDLNGRCSGRITINVLPGTVVNGPADFIRLEGVRGRIDASLAVTPGTDLFVDMQSINDPAANIFVPDRVRVAKSLDGMNVRITPDTLLLCFPTTGVPPAGTDTPDYAITITEGFARAFVDSDSGNNGTFGTDRVDSSGVPLGAPTNSTQFFVWLEQIPTSVSSISWPASVATNAATGSSLVLVSSTFDSGLGVATALYSFEAVDQTGQSDVAVESFTVTPVVNLRANGTTTGTIVAGVSMAPTTDALSGCPQPTSTAARPRFLRMFESDSVATNNPPDDPFLPYANVIRCNCYLLFTYVTADAGFNTGIAIANTTGDSEPFGANAAADQLGRITFYFYDRAAGFVGSTQTTADITAGRSYINLISAILPTGVTTFSGYVIAKADFQFCHGFAFIADNSFGSIAHGYVANVIPDPAIKNIGGRRAAAAAGDPTSIPAGESLNN